MKKNSESIFIERKDLEKILGRIRVDKSFLKELSVETLFMILGVRRKYRKWEDVEKVIKELYNIALNKGDVVQRLIGLAWSEANHAVVDFAFLKCIINPLIKLGVTLDMIDKHEGGNYLRENAKNPGGSDVKEDEEKESKKSRFQSHVEERLQYCGEQTKKEFAKLFQDFPQKLDSGTSAADMRLANKEPFNPMKRVNAVGHTILRASKKRKTQ